MIKLSIFKIKDFIKTNQSEILLFVCVFLIAAISFGLGLLTAPKINKEPIKIESCAPDVSQNLNQLIN